MSFICLLNEPISERTFFQLFGISWMIYNLHLRSFILSNRPIKTKLLSVWFYLRKVNRIGNNSYCTKKGISWIHNIGLTVDTHSFWLDIEPVWVILDTIWVRNLLNIKRQTHPWSHGIQYNRKFSNFHQNRPKTSYQLCWMEKYADKDHK